MAKEMAYEGAVWDRALGTMLGGVCSRSRWEVDRWLKAAAHERGDRWSWGWGWTGPGFRRVFGTGVVYTVTQVDPNEIRG